MSTEIVKFQFKLSSLLVWSFVSVICIFFCFTTPLATPAISNSAPPLIQQLMINASARMMTLILLASPVLCALSITLAVFSTTDGPPPTYLLFVFGVATGCVMLAFEELFDFNSYVAFPVLIMSVGALFASIESVLRRKPILVNLACLVSLIASICCYLSLMLI